MHHLDWWLESNWESASFPVSRASFHSPPPLRTFYKPFIQAFCALLSNGGGAETRVLETKRQEIKTMWIHEVAPERLAELFHHYHQALTSEDPGNRCGTHGAWAKVSQQEKGRLVAAARLALLELESMASDQAKSRKYFAVPGEAEWGC
jgi:hypothetical protein